MTELRLYTVKPNEVVIEQEHMADDVKVCKTRGGKVKLDERGEPVIEALGTQTVMKCPCTKYEYPRLPGMKKVNLLEGGIDRLWLVEAHPAIHEMLVEDERCTWLSWKDASEVVGQEKLLSYVLPGVSVDP